ncbi:hypothetical protein NLO88_18455 [Pseudomonas syringae]|uniref:hypothetical protein n=1 Tax=Pseudomonas sp. ICMP 561 TaxID=1718918 RepID=UPI0013DF1595|nr:hypothetical protein [Pseudomonas sp. ICMP 561]MCQ2995154.1 hypothetical protein [Pseudomonas syringae]MCQ3032638.1 hypothetical protein [Pseudomonas syringae]
MKWLLLADNCLKASEDAMSRIAIAELLEGQVVDWIEQEPDAEYASGFAPQP